MVWTFANGLFSVNLLQHLAQKRLSNSFQIPEKKTHMLLYALFHYWTAFLRIRIIIYIFFLWPRHIFVQRLAEFRRDLGLDPPGGVGSAFLVLFLLRDQTNGNFESALEVGSSWTLISFKYPFVCSGIHICRDGPMKSLVLSPHVDKDRGLPLRLLSPEPDRSLSYVVIAHWSQLSPDSSCPVLPSS